MIGRRRREEPFNWPEFWVNLRDDYRAVKDDRFRRKRTGYIATGSSADYHYVNEYDYLKLMELSRDFDRNDTVVGSLLDRSADNIVQGGLVPDPQSDDKELERDLRQRWAAWADDPVACDSGSRFTFGQIQWYAVRSGKCDGDMFHLPHEDGTLETLEGHRCRTPSNTKKNVIHGVLLAEGSRRPREYWFTREDIDPMAQFKAVADAVQVSAFDDAGNRLVFHTYGPKRISQTRGVSAFAPVFHKLAMLEDIDFAKLVQQQVVSCFTLLHEVADRRGAGPGPLGRKGAQTTETMADGVTRVIEGVSPGLEVWGRPGEVLKGFSPEVPNPGYAEQYVQVLRMVAAVLNVPLITLLLDASETNFSGWRGAINQAQIGWRRDQRALRDQLIMPVWRWKLAEWAAADPALRKRLDEIGVRIQFPRWPYIQPEVDVSADEKRRTALQASPREIAMDRARDWDELAGEIVADNSLLIRAALLEADAIAAAMKGVRIDPRQLIVLDMARPLLLGATGGAGGVGDGATPGTAGPVTGSAAPLNGAQITAAIDVMVKLRDGTLTNAAATELLIQVGVPAERATSIVADTPSLTEGTGDRMFRQQLLLKLADIPGVKQALYNGIDMEDTVVQTGLAAEVGYEFPWMPVVGENGPLVSGGTIKDPQNDVVGGDFVEQSAPEGPSPEQTMPENPMPEGMTPKPVGPVV